MYSGVSLAASVTEYCIQNHFYSVPLPRKVVVLRLGTSAYMQEGRRTVAIYHVFCFAFTTLYFEVQVTQGAGSEPNLSCELCLCWMQGPVGVQMYWWKSSHPGAYTCAHWG